MKKLKKGEKFKLLKFLGAGAFAQTHLAEVLDSKLRNDWGENVVIKIPLNKEKEEVLVNELIMNASLHLNLQKAKSKNIVHYLGYSKYDEFYVMVMEYVEGDTLRSYLGPIGEQEPLEIDEALNISEQLCEGLIEIHKCHIFHRDIKPENILICKKDNTVKILDLGIARLLKSTEIASTTAGTLFYMAKELVKGKGGSFHSDIYSLGITMYEMITGQLPFVGESHYEIIDKICNQLPKPPIEINPRIDKKLDRIILKAIEKEPEKRYKAVEDILESIRLYRHGKDEDDEQIEKCTAQIHELFSAGNFKDAEKRLKELVKKYPKNPKSYLCLGEFYNRCQRYREAIQAFNQGIQTNPDYAILYRDMALSLHQEGSKDEAIKAMKKAIGLGLESSMEKHSMSLLNLWEKR